MTKSAVSVDSEAFHLWHETADGNRQSMKGGNDGRFSAALGRRMDEIEA